MDNHIGKTIMKRRKMLGYTQQRLADFLNVSFQAVSKWENGSSCPDISLLPKIAEALETTADALLGYSAQPATDYEYRYRKEGYYWGLIPNTLCLNIMKLKPPAEPYRVLDIGCGEGKDAVFLAKNGYAVSAFDISDAGLKKARALAAQNNVSVDFFRADILDFEPKASFDIILSSGVFHYIPENRRGAFILSLKEHTCAGGINVINVFVDKPFIAPAPDMEQKELEMRSWRSGELFTFYHDWLFHKNDEVIFDCTSSGIPHRHCMDILIAEKMA